MKSFSRQITQDINQQPLVQVVGFGVSGLGVAFAADAQQRLEQLIKLGLVYLDGRKHSDFSGLRFQINSNSPAADFLAGIQHDGFFKPLFEREYGQQLLDMNQQRVPLELAADFFHDASSYLAKHLANHTESEVMWQAAVDRIRLEADGSLTSLNSQGEPLVNSRYVVMAAGGREQPNPHIQAYADHFQCPLLLSETILRGMADAELAKQINAGKKIALLGGSHSSFSIIDYLLKRFGEQLTPQQIVLITRSPVRVNYRDMPEFADQANADDPCYIDFETRGINRFSGLRGDAKLLYLKIVRGDEPRVHLQEAETSLLSPETAQQHYPDIGIVAQATGYSSAFPPLVDHQGNPIAYSRRQQLTALNGNYQLRCQQEQPIRGLYGVGLGGFVPEGIAFSTTREIPVGVNIYHQQDAAIVLNHIFDELENSVSDPAENTSTDTANTHLNNIALEEGAC